MAEPRISDDEALNRRWPGRKFAGADAATIAASIQLQEPHPFREWHPDASNPPPRPGLCGSCGRPEADHPFPWAHADPETVGRLVTAVRAALVEDSTDQPPNPLGELGSSGYYKVIPPPDGTDQEDRDG